jgi:hypothetical protein
MEAGIADHVWKVGQLLGSRFAEENCGTVERDGAITERSNVESQESCRHLMFSGTLIARSFSSFAA